MFDRQFGGGGGAWEAVLEEIFLHAFTASEL